MVEVGHRPLGGAAAAIAPNWPLLDVRTVGHFRAVFD
jgi:hypothetical protein